jgi:Reverse transcriptase (RNA-dependent DNA polymerase)
MLKRYPIRESRLYCLKSKKRLACLLNIGLPALRRLISQRSNYHVFSTLQSSGKPRVIEEPKGELKRVHSRLLKLLSRLEPPSYLHSGTKGRSYVTNAAAHVGRGKVVKTDISKFYQSTTHHRVFIGVLREFKCSGDVAKRIADLCTFEGHVPTGSPVSMPIAFLAHKQAFDEEQRRSELEGNTFTLYVDDLTLSGDSVSLHSICAIEKTFQSVGLKCHKTRLFEKSSPKLVTGVIVTGEGLCLPNRRHLRIAKGIEALAAMPGPDERKVISRKLLGQINEAASVEPRYRRRRIGLKKLVVRLNDESSPDRVLNCIRCDRGV